MEFDARWLADDSQFYVIRNSLKTQGEGSAFGLYVHSKPRLGLIKYKCICLSGKKKKEIYLFLPHCNMQTIIYSFLVGPPVTTMCCFS